MKQHRVTLHYQDNGGVVAECNNVVATDNRRSSHPSGCVWSAWLKWW